MCKALRLSSSIAQQIELEGVRAYPQECCGILLGSDESPIRTVHQIRPVANVFEPAERSRRFSIDPRNLLAAEREAAERGWSVLGFYHSHPDHPARPSEFDRERAWPVYSYVIVSIINRQAVDMTSWVLDDDTNTFRRQDIVEGD